MTKITVEVAYATPDKQKILVLEVEEGTTVYQAAEQSRIVSEFPEIILSESKMGIFGKTVRKPQEEVMREHDRVEIYRPLIIDPKAARLNRAAKSTGKSSLEKAVAEKEADKSIKG